MEPPWNIGFTLGNIGFTICGCHEPGGHFRGHPQGNGYRDEGCSPRGGSFGQPDGVSLVFEGWPAEDKGGPQVLGGRSQGLPEEELSREDSWPAMGGLPEFPPHAQSLQRQFLCQEGRARGLLRLFVGGRARRPPYVTAQEEESVSAAFSQDREV